MTADAFIFWLLAMVTLFSGIAVVMLANPIYSALCLAMTMIGVSALFVTLNAYFLAGVQMIVYAGAVMVLFVMVLMLFNLKTEVGTFAKGLFTGGLKIASVGIIAGLIVGSITLTNFNLVVDQAAASKVDGAKEIGKILFSQYVLGFEALGVLLLVIAVGTVALARSKGGTHAQH